MKYFITIVLVMIAILLGAWYVQTRKVELKAPTDSPYTKEKTNYYDPKYNCPDMDHCKG